MDKIEIDIVRLQGTKGFVKRAFSSREAHVLHEGLGSDEELLTLKTGAAYRAAHRGLVIIGAGRVNEAVPGL